MNEGNTAGRRIRPEDIELDMEALERAWRLTPSQRIMRMMRARAFAVALLRGRLRDKHPDLSEAEINLLMLEEIERAKRLRER